MQGATQLGVGNLWGKFLEQRLLAAIHVHHAAHAAVALAEMHRHTCESATKEHEQKEQGCKPLLHVWPTVLELLVGVNLSIAAGLDATRYKH